MNFENGVFVTGGRWIPKDWDSKSIHGVIEKVNPTVIVVGDAPGFDSEVIVQAKSLGLPSFRCNACWGKFGRAAGPIRNGWMIEAFPQIKTLLAFPGGAGTADMTNKCEKNGIKVLLAQDWRLL